MVDGLLAAVLAHVHDVRQGHQAAAFAAHLHAEQHVEVGLGRERKLHADRERVLDLGAVQVGDVLAAEQRAHGARHRRLRHAEAAGALTIDLDDEASARGLDAVVDVDDIRRAGKGRAHAPGDAHLPGVVRAVDLRHQRREHRRSRRHLDDLDIGARVHASAGERSAHGAGHVVALALTTVLGDEVDLDVAQVGPRRR